MKDSSGEIYQIEDLKNELFNYISNRYFLSSEIKNLK